jgi:predicted nucleic acid-binding protein
MIPPLKIFLDANILFSAAKTDGAIRSLATAILDAGHECWVDGYVLDEARRNVSAKSASALPLLDELVVRLSVSTVAPGLHAAGGHGLPDKDRLVLAAAAALGCDVLETGDRTHFGKLYGRQAAGVCIHSPRSLYEQLFPPS